MVLRVNLFLKKSLTECFVTIFALCMGMLSLQCEFILGNYQLNLLSRSLHGCGFSPEWAFQWRTNGKTAFTHFAWMWFLSSVSFFVENKWQTSLTHFAWKGFLSSLNPLVHRRVFICGCFSHLILYSLCVSQCFLKPHKLKMFTC